MSTCECTAFSLTPPPVFTKLASQLTADKLSELAVIPVIFVVQTIISYVAAILVSKICGFKKRASNFLVAMAVCCSYCNDKTAADEFRSLETPIRSQSHSLFLSPKHYLVCTGTRYQVITTTKSLRAVSSTCSFFNNWDNSCVGRGDSMFFWLLLVRTPRKMAERGVPWRTENMTRMRHSIC